MSASFKPALGSKEARDKLLSRYLTAAPGLESGQHGNYEYWGNGYRPSAPAPNSRTILDGIVSDIHAADANHEHLMDAHDSGAAITGQDIVSLAVAHGLYGLGNEPVSYVDDHYYA